MSISIAYRLDEARRMLELCKTAYEELITGQAKSYRVGTREFTSLDLNDLRKEIERWANIVGSLEKKFRSKNVARVIPRDL